MDAGSDGSRRGPYLADEATLRMLAESAIFGLPINTFIRTTSGTERDLYVAIHKRAIGVADDLIKKLAGEIVKQYGDAQKRGSKKG